MWLHMHGLRNHELNFCHHDCDLCMAPALPSEVTQSTTVPIKFVPPVSGLPLSVEAQTSVTRASTLVVLVPCPWHCTLTVALHWPSQCFMISIFVKYLNALIYGKWPDQASIDTHTRAQCSHTSVGLAPIITIVVLFSPTMLHTCCCTAEIA